MQDYFKNNLRIRTIPCYALEASFVHFVLKKNI